MNSVCSVFRRIHPYARFSITHILSRAKRCQARRDPIYRVPRGGANGRMCSHVLPFPTPWDAINRVPTHLALRGITPFSEDMGNDETPGELGGKTTELPTYLMDRTRIVIGKGQTYRGAWYDCVPALRIASMVCSVVSNTVVLTALT